MILLTRFTKNDREVWQMTGFAGCESCRHYVYNEDYECYECLVNLDEDETARFLSGHLEACPYYSGDDEYAIVRKQN